MPQNPKNFRLRRAFQKGVPYFWKLQESEKKGVPYSFRQNQPKWGRRSLLRGGGSLLILQLHGTVLKLDNIIELN